jgi:non-ribosomal peptide synthetase component E (peptide arylation enzyme)
LIETRLVDPLTNEVIEQPRQPGELRISGAATFVGYYRQPELNVAAFDGEGFFRTGDLFEIGGEKNELYRFVGRLKDIIIRGGVNISAEELETLLLEHPAVAEAAVIGYPDATLGEKLCAVLAPKKDVEPPTLASVVDFLRNDKRVAAFKLPERLELVAALPRNPMGKVQKSELRSKYS